MDSFETGRSTLHKTYNQFNGRTLFECIDDWTKRWNSWIPPESILDETSKSRIFLSFTRNAIIKYLANIAINPPKANVTAVNKKTGVANKVFAQFLKDLKMASERNENYDQKCLQFGLEVATKGTGIIYEGYLREEQKTKLPIKFNTLTGQIEYKEGKRVLFDDCYARVVPLEDFFIVNPYLSVANLQLQPKILWREVTLMNEAEREYEHYRNFKYVSPGAYVVAPEPTTFYRNKVQTEITKDQVEILRYYNKPDNRHIVMINGVIIYDGPIPFKDGKYPFAGAVFEPFGNDFFWGAGYPHKIMGDQDALNTSINLMMDKFYASSQVYGLSADLDDFVEDEILQTNRIRKVSDISKWKFDTLPGVTAGEQNMFQMILNNAREFSGSEGGANQTTPKGGRMPARQILLKQQEVMKSLGFSASFLEDYEEDRTKLRLSHLLQFYSIPKIEKVTGKSKEEQNKLVYRDVSLNGTKLGSGKDGNKIIKIIGDDLNPDTTAKMADDLSVLEMQGELSGTPTEALAIHIDTFEDWNYTIQIEKFSSFMRNQVLDQASRQEYSNWRIAMMQVGLPTDVKALADWVGEAWDVDGEKFTPQGGQPQGGQPQGMQVPKGQQQGPAQNIKKAMGSPLQQVLQ